MHSSHAVLWWLTHRHMTADQIRLAMVALVHQVQHLRLHHTTIWLTHIRGGGGDGKTGPQILVLTVKMGRGVLAARWG